MSDEKEALKLAKGANKNAIRYVAKQGVKRMLAVACKGRTAFDIYTKKRGFLEITQDEFYQIVKANKGE